MASRPDPTMVVLAGGRNTRLGALSGTIYKPFLPVDELTFLARHIARAALAGIGRVLIVTDHPDPLITSYVEGLRREAPDSVPGLHLISGAQRMEAKILLAATLSPICPFAVVLGDSYALYDPVELCAAAGRDGFDSAMAVAPYRLPFGVVDVSGQAVSRFREKPESGYLVNSGQLALGPAALDLLSDGVSLADVLARLARDGILAAVELASEFVTVDSLLDLASLTAGSLRHLEAAHDVD